MEKQAQKIPKYSQALRRLPQQARVGCVVIAIERALEDYPPGFGAEYHLDDAIKAAWAFVRKGSSRAEDDDRVADAISDELPNLDRAGYSYDHGLMAISLVLGFSRPPSLLAAFEYACRVWALGPGVSPESNVQDPDGLKGPVYERLNEAIIACKASDGATQWEKVIRRHNVSPASPKKAAAATKATGRSAKKTGSKKTGSKKTAAKKASKKVGDTGAKKAGAKTATKRPARKPAKK